MTLTRLALGSAMGMLLAGLTVYKLAGPAPQRSATSAPAALQPTESAPAATLPAGRRMAELEQEIERLRGLVEAPVPHDATGEAREAAGTDVGVLAGTGPRFGTPLEATGGTEAATGHRMKALELELGRLRELLDASVSASAPFDAGADGGDAAGVEATGLALPALPDAALDLATRDATTGAADANAEDPGAEGDAEAGAGREDAVPDPERSADPAKNGNTARDPEPPREVPRAPDPGSPDTCAPSPTIAPSCAESCVTAGFAGGYCDREVCRCTL